ncbi:hypothetical protein V1499_08135 [Neobacillus sp. SCS-31]|uniref:hypothetical protein n=1 Tax=Neobacillus oceani TaxID=3115292 RepID=UPI0039063205
MADILPMVDLADIPAMEVITDLGDTAEFLVMEDIQVMVDILVMEDIQDMADFLGMAVMGDSADTPGTIMDMATTIITMGITTDITMGITTDITMDMENIPEAMATCSTNNQLQLLPQRIAFVVAGKDRQSP